MEEASIHAIIHGRVQGVNFRAYTARKAADLNLTGWVRNRPDGTVETIAEGSQDALKDLVAFLSIGSPSAIVTRTDVTWNPPSGKFSDFKIRYFG